MKSDLQGTGCRGTLRCFFGAAALVVAYVASPAAAAVYVVTPDGTGDFPTIQAAIDAAVAGDNIELTDGTFSGDGNRDMDYLGKAITIRSQSGDPAACTINCGGQHWGFRFISNEGPASVLEGVTIRGSSVGATYCEGSSPTLVNCAYSFNVGVPAAGLLCVAASPELRDCTFSHNASASGEELVPSLRRPGYCGGMACYDDSSPVLTNCMFQNNNGGGMECQGNSSPTLTGCSFIDNYDRESFGGPGAGMLCIDSSPTLTECRFSGNSAAWGGGMFCGGSSFPTLIRCTFYANTALGQGPIGAGGAGGAVLCGDTTINSCTFYRNSAAPGGETGGMGGAVACRDATIKGCTFYGNSGTSGGAIFGPATITNTIIAFSTSGGAIDCDGAQPTLTCCDIYANVGGDWVGCIAGQAGINGNISEDPLFCAPENEDFTIRSDSPCTPFSPPNEECDLIGAWPVGCSGPTATQPTTWGRIKAGYRGQD